MFPIFKRRSDVSFLPEADDLRKRGYIIGYTIGEGAYAQVKNGYSTLLKKRIAIKVIHQKKTPDDFRDVFLPRELEICVSLKHRNITRIFDVFYYRNRIYIMMEHASHGSLLDMLKAKGKQTEITAGLFFIPMIRAIEYLHNQGIVHRDLKCENILLTSKNVIKITDFGFARYYVWGHMSKTYCGSTSYACPEVLKGIPYEPVSHDTWALGIILYVTCTAKFPYNVTNVRKMIAEQERNKIPFPCYLGEDVQHLLKSILDFNQKFRYRMKDIFRSPWIKAQSEHNRTSALVNSVAS